MNNAPKVDIKYLINYDLQFTNKSESSKLSSEANLNELEAKIKGKKGLHLNGGSVNETGEVSGTLLDGTYTFYKSTESSYNGWMSESFSSSQKLNQFDVGYPFINPSKYQSKTAGELEQILTLTNNSLGNSVSYYCTSDSGNFKAGNVYRFNLITNTEKQYNEELTVNSTTVGTYLIKTGALDAFGKEVYEEVELPEEYDPLKKYYRVQFVTHYHYVADLKEQAQFVDISTKNDDTYIKSILIYFDPVAAEYATKLSFSNAINDDGSTNNKFSPNTKIRNNKMIFMYNFGESSTLKSIRVNFEEWSKANSPLKILKIVTGYTGHYDYTTLLDLKWDNSKFVDEEQLSFGISSQTCSVQVIDKEDIVLGLYQANLFYQNIEVRVYIDDMWQGSFYIDTKDNSRGSQEWVYDCIDKFEQIKNDVVDVLQVTSNMTLKQIIAHILKNTGYAVEYTEEASSACDIVIPTAYIFSQQNVYDCLLKCCQIGLLRIYVSYEKLKITRGI